MSTFTFHKVAYHSCLSLAFFQPHEDVYQLVHSMFNHMKHSHKSSFVISSKSFLRVQTIDCSMFPLSPQVDVDDCGNRIFGVDATTLIFWVFPMKQVYFCALSSYVVYPLTIDKKFEIYIFSRIDSK